MEPDQRLVGGRHAVAMRGRESVIAPMVGCRCCSILDQAACSQAEDPRTSCRSPPALPFLSLRSPNRSPYFRSFPWSKRASWTGISRCAAICRISACTIPPRPSMLGPSESALQCSGWCLPIRHVQSASVMPYSRRFRLAPINACLPDYFASATANFFFSSASLRSISQALLYSPGNSVDRR